MHSWEGFPGNLNISVVMTFNVSLLRRSELVLIPFRNEQTFFKELSLSLSEARAGITRFDTK